MECMAAAQQPERHRCPFPARVCCAHVFRVVGLRLDAHTHLHDRSRRRSRQLVCLCAVGLLGRRLDSPRRGLEVLKTDRAPRQVVWEANHRSTPARILCVAFDVAGSCRRARAEEDEPRPFPIRDRRAREV